MRIEYFHYHLWIDSDETKILTGVYIYNIYRLHKILRTLFACFDPYLMHGMRVSVLSRHLRGGKFPPPESEIPPPEKIKKGTLQCSVICSDVIFPPQKIKISPPRKTGNSPPEKSRNPSPEKHETSSPQKNMPWKSWSSTSPSQENAPTTPSSNLGNLIDYPPPLKSLRKTLQLPPPRIYETSSTTPPSKSLRENAPTTPPLESTKPHRLPPPSKSLSGKRSNYPPPRIYETSATTPPLETPPRYAFSPPQHGD